MASATGRKATPLDLSMLGSLRCPLFEPKKVLTALEFSGSRAVFNSCKGHVKKNGEKILRRDIKWADKIGGDFGPYGHPHDQEVFARDAGAKA